MLRKKWFVIIGLLFLFPVTTVDASEAQQVETHGNIGFTGVYEPIGPPDPAPPDNITKPPVIEVPRPDGTLPQTNDLTHSFLVWLGIIIVTTVAICWKRKNYSKYNTKKVGIIK